MYVHVWQCVGAVEGGNQCMCMCEGRCMGAVEGGNQCMCMCEGVWVFVKAYILQSGKAIYYDIIKIITAY